MIIPMHTLITESCATCVRMVERSLSQLLHFETAGCWVPYQLGFVGLNSIISEAKLKKCFCLGSSYTIFKLFDVKGTPIMYNTSNGAS